MSVIMTRVQNKNISIKTLLLPMSYVDLRKKNNKNICFVLFCTLVMITDMFCIILYPCHDHRHVLYYFVPLSWSQTCFVLLCTLVMITDMLCIILYPCHDHRHVLYYCVPLSWSQTCFVNKNLTAPNVLCRFEKKK
jgi:hypothetical protein